MRRRRVCFVLGLSLAANLPAARHARAGAWLEPPGQGQVIASTDFSDSTRYFDASGKLIPIPAYQKFSLGTYIEYGLSDEFTLVTQPFFDSDRQNTMPNPTRLVTGGTDIGLRAAIVKTSDTVVSVQATAHVPFDMRKPIVNFDEDSVLSGDFRLLIGHSFKIWTMDSFVDLESSYRIEADDIPDEWHADATFGVRPRRDLMLLLQSFATVATRTTQLSPCYDGIMHQRSIT